MEQKFKDKNAEQYFKFHDAVMLNIADDMHFMRKNGIYKHSGKIGSNLSYDGCMEIVNDDYRLDVHLTKNINSNKTEDLCRVSGWSEFGFDMINVMTRKACLNPRDAEFKKYEGISRYDNSYVGLLSVEYGKGEDPDLFLANLFQTIERSRQHAKETVNQQVEQSGTGKKLSKLNLVAKLAHLVRRQRTTEQAQEM